MSLCVSQQDETLEYRAQGVRKRGGGGGKVGWGKEQCTSPRLQTDWYKMSVVAICDCFQAAVAVMVLDAAVEEKRYFLRLLTLKKGIPKVQ